jgi:hypothetical protein
MAMRATFHRMPLFSVAMIALLLPVAPMAIAADVEDMPFAQSREVADAALDTMRGGFDMPKQGVKVPFGLDVHFDVSANGKQTADLDISNGGDKNRSVKVTEKGIGVTNVVAQGPGGQMTTVTTDLTNHGIITIVQNTRSNAAIHTVQTLNATLTGMRDIVRLSALNNLHNSRVLFH